MPRGGYRPGAGRKTEPKKKPAKINDENADKIKSILQASQLAKAKMLSEFINRMASGDQMTTAEKKIMLKLEQDLSESIPKEKPKEENIEEEAKKANLTPLEYMMLIMNDDKEDKDRRDKMAIAAAPYIHMKSTTAPGKKEEKDEKAKAAASGRFKPSSPPVLKAVK